ncbi:MAG: hypothetical protein IKF36_02920 [Bacilli bacterium]|nr:hypothetical protein [Bacilli bacterium]
MDFIKKYGKYIGIGAMILTIIGVFLPIATVSSSYLTLSVNYIDGDGIIILIAMIISIVLFLLNKIIPPLILTIISLGITLYDSINASRLFNTPKPLVDVGFGIGFYITLTGLLISLVIVIMALIDKKTSK